MSRFSPSVNLIRDHAKSLNYIPTENSANAFSAIFSNAPGSTNSFCIIGTYGTGKSSFLVALERHLDTPGTDFGPISDKFNSVSGFEFINVVGEYDSLPESFSKTIGLEYDGKSKSIINHLEKHYQKLKKKNKALLIVIDELGKHLEYASSHNPEEEFYFIQQLAEFVNDPDKKIIFLSTLHQDFESYLTDLSKSQIKEWDKVKGRLKEIPFNEPVEQLLNLASKYLEQSFLFPPELKKSNKKLLELIESSKAFPLKSDLSSDLSETLFPFDLLSAGILTKSLQLYGQNERSLFTFLESHDNGGLRYFESPSGYFNISHVFDYLTLNFHSYLNTSKNPDYIQWSALRTAIERTEGLLQKRVVDALKIVKTIGLLDRFGNSAKQIDEKFLVDYASISLGIDDPKGLIHELEKQQIIRFVNFKNSYILYEGSDLNIEVALQQIEDKVNPIENVVPYINKYFSFPFIIDKKYLIRTGTPRVFGYSISNVALSEIENTLDGAINLIFPLDKKQEDYKALSSNKPILYGVSKSTSETKSTLFEIEKIKKVIDDHQDDRVAIRELRTTLENKISYLNQLVVDTIYTGGFDWYYNGKKHAILSYRAFNIAINEVSEAVYYETPIFKNELINKGTISATISSARRKLFENLINKHDQELIGFEETKFPAEKSIFISLIERTGVHKKNKDGYFELTKPNDKSFDFLWQECEEFLKNSQFEKSKLPTFFEKLKEAPLGLKSGFLEFWIPLFLIIKRNDIALYYNGAFVPNINLDVIDLLIKRPQDFELKSFYITGVKLDIFNQFRTIVDKASDNNITSAGFIETIKPFLVFYNNLSVFSKQTSRVSTHSINFRNVIKNAKDPEKVFFEDFPKALGFTSYEELADPEYLKRFSLEVQGAINELRDAYPLFIDRLENYLGDKLNISTKEFLAFKQEVGNRYIHLKSHLLLPHQKTFITRINSPLDDREAWFNSIVQPLISKSLANATDLDEDLLYERINEIIFELDNLLDMSKVDFDPKKEDVYTIDISKALSSTLVNTFRISKKMYQNGALDSVRKELGQDKRENIIILTKLLEEQLKDDQN